MAMAMRAVARLSSRRMSSLAVAGQAASVQLNQEGMAELPKTLPIHKRGEDQLVREGAQACMDSGQLCVLLHTTCGRMQSEH